MKESIIAIVLMLVTLPAFAKDKKYVHAGTVAYSSFNSNAEAHVPVNGKRHDAIATWMTTRRIARTMPGYSW